MVKGKCIRRNVTMRHHNATKRPVAYMIMRPAMRPPAINGVQTVSGLCLATILCKATTTCTIAPMPMLKNSVAQSGE